MEQDETKEEIKRKMKFYAQVAAISSASMYAPQANAEAVQGDENTEQKTLIINREIPTIDFAKTYVVNQNGNEEITENTADTTEVQSENNNQSESHYVRLKYDEVPEVSPENAAAFGSYDYIVDLEKWRKDGVVDVKRADWRDITTPDMTSVMNRRECGEYGQGNLQKGETNQEECDVGIFCTQEDLYKHITDPNNLTAKQVNNAVNINKSKTRCFLFQADVDIAKNMLRYMYCSNNEAAHDFAAKFIADNSNNQAVAAEVREALYDETTNDFKIGDGAVEQRYKAGIKMRQLTVNGINVAGSKRLSNTFITALGEFDKEHHKDLLQLEKDFATAVYPLANKENIPAEKAQKIAASNGMRDASCVGIGTAGLYTASLIGCGAYSWTTLKELKQTVNSDKFNKLTYASPDYIRQMAIAGYKGADEFYSLVKVAVKESEKQVKQAARGFSTISFEQRTDAIKGNIRNPEIQPIPMMLQKNKGR
jgi:hypothetical protein